MIVPHLHKKKGYWYFNRRVPAHFKHIDDRDPVLLSTKIRVSDDPRAIRAKEVVAELNATLEAFWEAKANGINPDGLAMFKAAHAKARKHALPYITVEKVSELPAPEFFQRMELLKNPENHEDADGILGLVDAPPHMVSELLTEHSAAIETILLKKSPRQLKRWKNERTTQLNFFMGAIGGDMDVTKLTKAHIDLYRDALTVRIKAGLEISSANSCIGRISSMLKSVNETYNLDMPDHFAGRHFKGAVTRKRNSFDIEFVQDMLLKDGGMDKLNLEARALIYITIETGMRLSEICNLTKDNIVLNHKHPHLHIEDTQVAVKSVDSVRRLPIVGVALMAFRAFPEGFPNYYDYADRASATINKFLHNNNFTGKRQTLYSLRHTFKDRLRLARTHPQIIEYLMGHAQKVTDYGTPTLKEVYECVNGIAFTPPSRI